MRKAQILLAGFLLVLAACSATSEREQQSNVEPTQVVLSADSELTYTTKPDLPDYFYFDGQLALTGLVLAYWEALYLEAEPTSLDKAQPVREMHLRFYPDAESKEELPGFQSSSEKIIRPQRIFLYRSSSPGEPLDTLHSAYAEDEMAKIEEVVQGFSELPANFLSHREGFSLQPARLVLDNLVSFVEGDHRFLYGMAQSLEPLSLTEYGLEQIPDSEPDSFLGRPWVETFCAPRPLAVLDAPEQGGRVITELPAGTIVEKVRTVDEGWVAVRVKPNEEDVVSGYVQSTELLVVN